MPPYRYDSAPNRFAPSIAEILSRRGDIAARHADQVGAVQARAAERQGQIVGNGIASVGQMLAAIPQQQRQQRLDALQAQNVESQIQDRNAQAAERERSALKQQRLDATNQQIDRLMQHAFVDDPETGTSTFNRQVFEQSLVQSGLGHLYPTMAETLDKLDQSSSKMAAERRLLVAKSILGVQDHGNSPDAVAIAIANLKKNHAITDDHAQMVVDAMSDDPSPEHIGALMSELGQAIPEYRDLVHTEEKRKADLAKTAAETAKLQSEATNGPKRTDTEASLDAYAKSLGKTRAEDLTYPERQTYETTKAQSASDLAFAQHTRERQYDNAHPTPTKGKSQDELEQEYRTVLARGLSSRSGGLGLEDQKVQQANHLLALLEQTYDPKTGSYTIPKTLQGELAAGLARLVAPGGNVGIEMMREFDQRTAKGDLAGALSYVTGHPFPTATQDFANLLKDSIERQGRVAQENREGEMSYLRNLAPTTLDEARRLALESTSLNALRQSRIAVDATGQRRLFVSTDGGKTWK